MMDTVSPYLLNVYRKVGLHRAKCACSLLRLELRENAYVILLSLVVFGNSATLIRRVAIREVAVETLVEKILVPVDGSRVMERNVKFACDLVKAFGGTMTLMHVVVLPASMEPGVPIDPTPLEQAGARILEAAQRIAEENGCKSDGILETDFGNAGHRIVRIAQEKGFTLIMIGARGGSKIVNLLLGSVCHTVAHNATSPVLIIRP